MDHRSFLALAAAVGFVGCGSGPSAQPAPPAPSGSTPQQVTGTERVWWDQTMNDPAESVRLRYAAYVDETRSELPDSSCVAGQAGAPLECSSSLPPMSPGLHTLQLAAYLPGYEVLESERSSPIQIQVTGTGTTVAANARMDIPGPARATEAPVPPALTRYGAVARARAAAPEDLVSLTTTDGVRLRVEVVAEGLVEPTDVAFAPSGRVFVGERGGRILLVRDGVLQPAPAATLEDVTTAGDGGLLGLAVDPEFQGNRFVYTIHTAPAGDEAAAFRVLRLRETQGTLVEPIVLLDGVSASATSAAASVRFGPDGKLYVALDDGGNRRLAGDWSSFSGKILRMNADGSTPDDQPAATPVYSDAYQSPRGLDWQPGTGTLWVADSPSLGSKQLTAVAAVEGRPRRARTVATLALPPSTGAAGMSFYRGEIIPAFQNDLLVAATPGGYILRVRFDSRDPLRIVATERLLEDRVGLVGPVRMVTVGPDGAVYFCTGRVLARLVPDARR